MRITNTMMAANTIRNINNAANRLAKAQEVVTSQQTIQQPSDDPVVATRTIKYRNYVATVEQYQTNVETATSWQEVTESALQDLNKIITDARTLTSQADNDTLSEDQLAAIKEKVEVLLDEAVQTMNSTYAGRYVFAGFSTGEAPYELVDMTDSSGNVIGQTVTFKGEYLSLGGVVSSTVDSATLATFCEDNASNVYTTTAAESINYNIGFNGAEVTVNVEGQDVVGEGAGNLFDTFAKLLLALDGETSYQTTTFSGSPATATVTTESLDDISTLLTEFDENQSTLLAAQATLGARMNYVTTVSDRLANDLETYETLQSNNIDADTAESSSDLSTAQYVYEASLAVGAKVVSKTLIDYIA